MSTAKNAQVSFESGAILHSLLSLTDSGDHKTFSSTYTPWSKATGKEPDIRPDGVISGGALTPGAISGDIAVAAATYYIGGVSQTYDGATSLTVTRPTGYGISSIVLEASGITNIIAGDASLTAFSDVRGAEGGPPLIPVDKIEIGQFWSATGTSGAVLESELHTVAGQHVERFDYPAWTVDSLGGTITFSATLPLIHTGGIAKTVKASIYVPTFENIELADAFVPAEITSSVSSTVVYGATVNGESSSLSQAKFNAYLNDGHTDSLLSKRGDVLIFKFKSDRNRAPYSLTQGRFQVSRTYPASTRIIAACTISADSPSRDFSGV